MPFSRDLDSSIWKSIRKAMHPAKNKAIGAEMKAKLLPSLLTRTIPLRILPVVPAIS